MNGLKIDLDGNVTPCRWGKWCRRAVHALTLAGLDPEEATLDVRRSPSGGVHVRLRFPPHTEIMWRPVEVVALQAILGSDPKREALNLRRATTGQPGNVLHTRRDGEPWGTPWPAALATWRATLVAWSETQQPNATQRSVT